MQNPKFEYRNSKQIPNSNHQNPKQVLNLKNLDFDIVSYFVLRASNYFSIRCLVLLFFIFIISPISASALTRQLPLSGQLLTPAKMAVPDGDYTMRFAIYDKDRTASDPYPSDADSTARIWTETQTVKVERGLWKVTLGSATALPDSLNFETGNYYLGIRINTDPEMVPRKKILPVPLALNAESLGGAKPGTGNNDILQLDSAGAINIAGNITTAGILQGANLIIGTAIQLPANSILTADIMDGTISTIDLADGLITSVKLADNTISSSKLSDGSVSGVKLADNAVSSAKLADASVTVSKIGDGAITTIKLSDGSVSTAKLVDLAVTTAKIADASITVAKLATGDLHFQNTDTGTTSLAFGLGTGTAIGTNNFSITASNAASKPAVRYNGTTGKWQISNDGATFADIASATSATLQGAYDAGNTITTTDGRNILFTLADTATDSSFIVNIQGAANVFQIQDAGTPIFTVADGGLATFGGNINLSGNRIISTSRIDGYPGSNFMSARVDLTYGSYSSIILDSSDLPHIAYQRNWDNLSIADWDGTQWIITDIDTTTGDVGEQADFVIDNAGVKHISYSNNYTTGSPAVDDDDLMYAKYVGTGGNCSGSSAWQCTVIDATGNIASVGTSIDFDASNNPHISYYDQTNTNLKHAWFVGGSGGTCAAVGGSAAWNCETVEAANDVGRFSAIAINRATGDIHITYFDNTNGDLRYIKYSGSAWGASDLLDGRTGCIASGCAETGTVGGYSYGSNLILDASGNPRVAYYNSSAGDLYYASYNGAAWTTSLIEGGGAATGSGCATSGDYGYTPSLDLDASGNPHISYHVHSSLENLQYAFRNGSSWTCQTADSLNNVGDNSSIQITTANKVYISHTDSTSSDLKLTSNNYPKLNIYSDVAIMGETGNLGIGTLTPTERLEVVGGIKASGNISGDNITASNDLTANDDLIVGDDAWIPTLFGSSSNNGALTLNSTSATPKGDIYINPGGQKTVIGNSIASGSLATAGLQITPNYLYIQYRYYNPGTGYTFSGNTGEANSYGGTPFTLVSAVGDMAYFGSYQPFGALDIDLAALGAGGAVAWEYWNGAWVALTATDGTSNFTVDGNVVFTPPSDWVTTYVDSTSNIGYWIRANVTTTAYTTAPTANSTIIGRFGTATAPLVAALIQPAGIADSTSWSATGTMLGINTPSSFNGNLVDLQVAGSSKFVVTSAGNVGIGTASPQAKLQVAGSGFFGGDSGTLSNSAGIGVRIFYDTGIATPAGSILAWDYTTGTPKNLLLQGGSTPGGSVGIGTSSINAASTLQVQKAGGTGTTNPTELRVRNSTSQGSGQIVFEEGSQGDNFKIRYHSLSSSTNNWLEFFGGSDAIPRLTIKRDADIGYGQIGINVASGSDPLGNLDIRQYANNDTILYARRNTDTSPTGNFIQFQNAAGASTLFQVDVSGNVGIGTGSPGEKLEVVGNIISKGTSWTSRTNTVDNNWGFVTYGNGLFVAVANSGTGNRVMTSPDGINWTIRTSAADNDWHFVAYGNGMFVAVASTGTGNRVMTSPDGITWTSRTSAADHSWRSVAYGNGLFVAVACGVSDTLCNTTSGNRVMTSPDGITWTSRADAADNEWRSVTYGNGLFVAVATSGTGNRVMTSTDGISWAPQANPVDNAWQEVTYGNGLFVAVATDGTGNRVMTSPNGTAWTSRTSAADHSWRSVVYANGLFVAVSCGVNDTICNSTAGSRVMTSPDGITWTSRTSAADNSWNSVAYGNGVFVSVASTGTNNRVMTSGKTELNALAHNNIYQGGMSIPGNVVIGIPNTTGNKFELKGLAAFEANNSNMNVYFQNDSGVNVGQVQTTPSSVGFMGANDTDAYFTDDSFNGIIVKDGGNVGIGTTSPSEELAILQNAAGSGILGLWDGANNNVVAVADGGSATFKPAAFDAVYRDNGAASFTDNSIEAKTSGGTTFTILSIEASSNDEFYVGLDHPFSTIYADTQNTGATVTLSAQYWNGAWNALSITDGTSNLTADGTITFTAPSDWATTLINGATKYWVRLRSPGTNITSAPNAYSISPTSGSRLAVYGQTGDTEPALHISDKGSVSIGDDLAAYKFDVKGTGGKTYFGVNTANSSPMIFIGGSAGETTSGSTNGRHIIRFHSSGTEGDFYWDSADDRYHFKDWNDNYSPVIAGMLGLNTATPTAALQVQATSTSSGANTMIASSGASTFTTDVSITINTGDYIIPTTTTGQARSVTVGGTGTSFTVTPAFSADVGIPTPETFTIYPAITNLTDNSGNTGLFLQGGTRDVGIGTTAPMTGRDKAVESGATIYSGSKAAFLQIKGAGNTLDFSSITLESDEATDKAWQIIHRKGGSDINKFMWWYYNGTTWAQKMVLDTGGNLGINTAAPSGNLDIRQIADGNQVIYARRKLDASPTGNFIQFQNTVPNATLFEVDVNGNVGIGRGSTTSYSLEVSKGVAGVADLVRLQNSNGPTNNYGAQLLFSALRTTSGLTNVAGISGIITDITDTAYKGALILSTADNAAPVERARIDNVGNVSFGVNVTSGTTTIDLGGTGTGNAVCHTTQTGTDNEGLVDCTSGPIADYAEMYPVAGGIDYGDIVAVGTKMLKTKDGDNIVQLVKSGTPYQSTTIGIVSNNYGDFTSAGYNIRKEDNPMPVALNGRVPVKVSLENGPIAVGDPLTSSSTPGVAMKATGAGYVIGKALESIDESGFMIQDSGKILVFVNPGWYTPSAMYAAQGGEAEFAKINIGGMATVGDLVVAKSARFEGTLTVLDDAIFAGNVLAQKEVRVGGKIIAIDVDLSGGLIVQKSARFKNDLEILGTALFRGPAEFDQAVKLNGGLDVQGQAKFATDINVIGNITADKGVFNELLVSGPVVINGDLSLEGKIVSDLKIEKDLIVKGLIKAKGIVGGWRSYENHFLSSKFENEFTASAGGASWEYHKIKLATDSLAGSKTVLDHSFNFKPADDENGATWRFMIKTAEIRRTIEPQNDAEFRFGLYNDEKNYALIQNGTEPQTMKFISCAVGECTTTDNIPVDPAVANRNYIVMVKSGEVKLLIEGQEYVKHIANVPADSILHFREEIATNIDASQSAALDYLGVIVGRYEPF